MDIQYFFGAFFLAAAIIGCFLLYLLLTERGVDLSRRLLILLTTVMVLVLIDSFVIAVRLYRVWPHTLFLFSGLWLSIPALLFLFTRYSIRSEKKFTRWELLHFVSSLAFFLFNLNFYFLTAEAKIRIGDFVYDQSGLPGWFSLIFYVQNYAYLLWVYPLRGQNRTRVDWLRAFWRIWLVVVVFDSVLTLFALGGYNVRLLKDLSIFFYSFQAYFLVISLLRKPRLFFFGHQQAAVKYRSSTASMTQLEALVTAANRLMREERLYLQKDLRQQQLATRLEVNPVVLSQSFDTVLGKSFTEWVHQYRIDYAMELIRDGYLQDFSVEALAEASGYASKVSFYRHFKRLLGQTPYELWTAWEERFNDN